MARKPADTTAKPADPRKTVVEALMALAASRPYDSISLADICIEANIPLVDLRDLFPSKGAILGGFLRMTDREVLTGTGTDMTGETTHDRVLDVMMRRFDSLGPYREGLRSVRDGLRRDPISALAFNQAALNSWRYMLEAAGVTTEGALGALKLQGAVLVFARAFDVWLDDDADMARTMAALDRELQRGERVLGQAEALHRFTAPFRGFARAACNRRASKKRDETSEASAG